MSESTFEIKRVRWHQAYKELQMIRTEVFIKEQQVPETLEWDEFDVSCDHLLVVTEEHQSVATSRILSTGQIGRMAVLKAYRHQGIGKRMLEQLLDIAEQLSLERVFLNAQITAIDFYKQFGFTEQGNLFNDAGIMHKRMTKNLK